MIQFFFQTYSRTHWVSRHQHCTTHCESMSTTKKVLLLMLIKSKSDCIRQCIECLLSVISCVITDICTVLSSHILSHIYVSVVTFIVRRAYVNW